MVLVFSGSKLSLDEQVFYIGRQFQWITVGDYKVGDFALLNCTNLAAQAKDLSRINCDGAQCFVVGQTMRHGIGGILPETSREGVVETGDCKFYAGNSKLGRLRQFAIIRIIFFSRKREHRAKNDGNILRAKKIFYLIGFFAAAENHLQLLLVAEFHGIADVARAVGKYKHGQFAANDRREGFELQVAVVSGDRALFHRLSVMARAVEPIRKLIDLLVVFLLGFRVRFFLAREGREVESLRLDLRPIERHGRALLNEHFINGPTSEMNCGRLTTDGSPAAAKVKAAAGRNGKNFRDAGSAGDGNVLA